MKIGMHVVGATCDLSGLRNPVSGSFPTIQLPASPTDNRMAAKPENFTQAGFFFGRVVLHTTVRADVRGCLEENRMRFSHAAAQSDLCKVLTRTGNKDHHGRLAHCDGHPEEELQRQAKGGHSTSCYSWPTYRDEPYALHVFV